MVLETTVLPTELFSFKTVCKMLQYLLEIKNRLILSIFFLFTVSFTAYTYKEFFLFLLIKTTQLSTVSHAKPSCYFIFTNVTELFTVYTGMAVTGTAPLFMYYFFFQTLNFFSFALFKTENRFARRAFKTSFCFWALSLAFAFYYGIFAVWEFFLSFQNFELLDKKKIYFETRLEDYVSFCLEAFAYAFLYFQIATIPAYIFLSKNVSRSFVKKYKKTCLFLLLSMVAVTCPEFYFQLAAFSFSFLSFEFLCFMWLTSRAYWRVYDQGSQLKPTSTPAVKAK